MLDSSDPTSSNPIDAPTGQRSRLSPLAAGWLIALIGWTSIVSFYGMSGGADFEPTDAWVSQTAREMYEATDWTGYVIPRFSGEVRMQKSPGPYWAVCLTAWLRGTPIDEVATRIPNAISAVLLVVTVFWLTRNIAGERAAIFAGFATASSALVLYWSHRGASDLGVTALMAFSLAALWTGSEQAAGRKQIALWMLGYFAAGLAMLYKQPMPLLGVGVPAVLYVILCNRWRIFASAWHLLGLALFFLPWLPWWIALATLQMQAAPAGESTDFLTTLHKWRVEYIDRVTGDLPNVEDQRGDWRLYLLYIGAAFAFSVPWCLSIPPAIGRAFRRDEFVVRRGQWFLLTWLFGITAVLMIAAGKETRYFLPAMPPLLCLLGIELARFFDPRRRVRPLLDIAGFLVALLVVPGVWIAGAFAIRKLIRFYGEYAVYSWDDIALPYIVTAVLFSGGTIAAAWLYWRRKEHASFGTLVATMIATFMYAWGALMPTLASEAPFRDFAMQLRERVPVEHRSAIRQVAQQDSRIIWYSDVRFPRVIDQLELLRMQGGKRERDAEIEIVAREMVRLLRGEPLALFVIEPAFYAGFQIGVPQQLPEGETPPPIHTWLVGNVGRPDHRYVLFGNKPPPWSEPRFALPEKIIDRVVAELKLQPSEVSRRLTLPKSDAARLTEAGATDPPARSAN